MENSTSLVVVKKGIIQKIQEFFRRIFRFGKKDDDIITTNAEVENTNKIQENLNKLLKKNENSDIKELINKIQEGKIELEELESMELTDIEEKLVEYLEYLEQEIQDKRNEVNLLSK